MSEFDVAKESQATRAVSVVRSFLAFLAMAGCLASTALLPIILFVAWFLVSGYINNPKDEIIADRYAPGLPDVHSRLWRVPWKGLGGGADTFAVQLVSLRRHQDVQVFGTDEQPLEIVWRDATNLEIALPNLAFVGDHPREAFGVTVHVRVVAHDPDARRKYSSGSAGVRVSLLVAEPILNAWPVDTATLDPLW